MDLLITVIGNAVADANFREALLNDPLAAIQEWGFRLTKGDVEMLLAIFHDQSLRDEFKDLEDGVYGQFHKYLVPDCTGRPCRLSAYHPSAS
jgi:hypothetical protein